MPIIELLMIWYKIKCRNPRSVYFIFQYTLETTSKYSLMKHFEILSYLHASLNNKVFVPFLNFNTFVSCLIFNIRFYFITWNKLTLFVILPAYREKNAIVFLSGRTIIKATNNQRYITDFKWSSFFPLTLGTGFMPRRRGPTFEQWWYP